MHTILLALDAVRVILPGPETQGLEYAAKFGLVKGFAAAMAVLASLVIWRLIAHLMR